MARGMSYEGHSLLGCNMLYLKGHRSPAVSAGVCCGSQGTRRQVPWSAGSLILLQSNHQWMSVTFWVSEGLFKHCTELKKEKLLCTVLLSLYEIQLLNLYFPYYIHCSPAIHHYNSLESWLLPSLQYWKPIRRVQLEFPRHAWHLGITALINFGDIKGWDPTGGLLEILKFPWRKKWWGNFCLQTTFFPHFFLSLLSE